MATPPVFDPATFADSVRAVVRRIPAGQVMSYSEVAQAVGAPRHARAVARVMASNYLPDVPCHRVIRSNGSLGGYNRGGEVKKRALLRSEGYPSERLGRFDSVIH